MYKAVFSGPLSKLKDRSQDPGVYRLQGGPGCPFTQSFIVTDLAVILRVYGDKVRLETVSRRDGSPQPGISFLALRNGSPVLQGVAGQTGIVPLDRFETPLTFRFSREPANPSAGADELTVSSLGPTRIEKARLFAAPQSAGVAYSSISSVPKLIRLQDEAGRLFEKVGVKPPLQAGYLPALVPFQRDLQIEVSDESGHKDTLRVAGTPPLVFLPPPGSRGDRLFYVKDPRAWVDIYVKGMKGSAEAVLFSHRVVDDSTVGTVPLPTPLEQWKSQYDAVWVEAGGLRVFCSFPTSIPGYAPLAAGSIYEVKASRPDQRVIYRHDGIEIVAPGNSATEPISSDDSAGLWIGRETAENGVLRFSNEFVPVVAGGPLHLDWEADSAFWGGVEKALLPSAPAFILVLITDPLFDPYFLQPTLTPPQVISTFRLKDETAVSQYRTGLDPALVYGVYPFQKNDAVKIQVPPSPGIYRLTVLVPQADGFQLDSRFIEVREGIYHRERIPVALLPGEAGGFGADFLPLTRGPTHVMVQSDLPVGVNLNPGEWRTYTRALDFSPDVRSYAITGKWTDAAAPGGPAPLLFSGEVSVVQDLYRGRGDLSFQDLVTGSLAPSNTADPAWLLRALYLYAKPDGGFGFLMEKAKSDEMATAWALLALRRLEERGAAVDGAVLEAVGNYFVAHPASTDFARTALLGSNLAATPPQTAFYRGLLDALKKDTKWPVGAPAPTPYLSRVFGLPGPRGSGGSCPLFPEEALRDWMAGRSVPGVCKAEGPSLVKIAKRADHVGDAIWTDLSISSPKMLDLLLIVIRHPRSAGIVSVRGLAVGDEMDTLPGELVLMLTAVQARDIRIASDESLGNLPLAVWSPAADAGYPVQSSGGNR